VDIVDNVCKPFHKSVKMYHLLKKQEGINVRKTSVSRELHNNSTFSVDKAVDSVDRFQTVAQCLLTSPLVSMIASGQVCLQAFRHLIE
jgi:hypothetical protein